MRRADGKIESQEITVRQMLRESAPLWEMADYCRRCPVNRDDAFGCFASINYPLSAQAERWLAEVGKEAGKAEDLRGVLLRFLADQQETGKNFARLRQDPDGTYLEAKQPGAFTVESVLVPRTTFTTDMLLETMFAVGVMSATHSSFCSTSRAAFIRWNISQTATRLMANTRSRKWKPKTALPATWSFTCLTTRRMTARSRS